MQSFRKEAHNAKSAPSESHSAWSSKLPGTPEPDGVTADSAAPWFADRRILFSTAGLVLLLVVVMLGALGVGSETAASDELTTPDAPGSATTPELPADLAPVEAGCASVDALFDEMSATMNYIDGGSVETIGASMDATGDLMIEAHGVLQEMGWANEADGLRELVAGIDTWKAHGTVADAMGWRLDVLEVRVEVAERCMVEEGRPADSRREFLDETAGASG